MCNPPWIQCAAVPEGKAPKQTAVGCSLLCVRTITNKKNRHPPRNPLQHLDLLNFSSWTFAKRQ